MAIIRLKCRFTPRQGGTPSSDGEPPLASRLRPYLLSVERGRGVPRPPEGISCACNDTLAGVKLFRQGGTPSSRRPTKRTRCHFERSREIPRIRNKNRRTRLFPKYLPVVAQRRAEGNTNFAERYTLNTCPQEFPAGGPRSNRPTAQKADIIRSKRLQQRGCRGTSAGDFSTTFGFIPSLWSKLHCIRMLVMLSKSGGVLSAITFPTDLLQKWAEIILKQ